MDNVCSWGVILYDFHSIVGSPRWLAILTKLRMRLLCRWVTTTVVWGSFDYHPFGVCGRKPVFWVQNGVQMMQQKETCLTYGTANAFRWWFAYGRRFNSRFVSNSEGYPKGFATPWNLVQPHWNLCWNLKSQLILKSEILKICCKFRILSVYSL